MRACGPNHPRWTEERMITDDGYVKLRVGTDHPLADPNGYAYEHLIIWVAAGNPRPPRGFLLHHKNDHRSDNRYGNLKLRTIAEHAGDHGQLKLTPTAAKSIREQYAAGIVTQAKLAQTYGVPHQRISKVIKGRIFKSAGGPISKDDNRARDPRTGRVVGRAGRHLDGRTWDGVPEVRL